MQLFLKHDKSVALVNTYQALKALNVKSDSSFNEIKDAYRKLALAHHPDKSTNAKDDSEFKRVTEAYNILKKNHNEYTKSSQEHEFKGTKTKTNFKRKPQWGAPTDEETPQQEALIPEVEEQQQSRILERVRKEILGRIQCKGTPRWKTW